jgi:hypothetical protein
MPSSLDGGFVGKRLNRGINSLDCEPSSSGKKPLIIGKRNVREVRGENRNNKLTQ